MKKQKALLTVILFLIAIFSINFVLNVSAENFEEGSGTIDDPYMIYTVEDLLEVGKYHNKSVYFEQGADINLKNVSWAGIYMYGNYNGNGFVISNLNNSSGLFAKNTGTITNVKLENVNITRKVDMFYGQSGYLPGSITIGAIADENEGLIENCYVADGKISTSYYSQSSIEDNFFNIGGIAGYSNGTIKNCVNSADITVYGSFFTSVGGICGISENKIEHCLNTGDIYAYVKTTTFYYNGFCKVLSSGISIAGSIYDCANTGNITATGETSFCPPTYGGGDMDGFYNPIQNDAYFIGGDIESLSYCSSDVECVTTIPNDDYNASSSNYTRTEEDNVVITDKESIIHMWSDVLNLKKPYIPYTMEISGVTERYAYVGGTGVYEPGKDFDTDVLLSFSPGTTDYTGYDIEWKSSDTDIFKIKSNNTEKSGRSYLCTCSIYAKKNGKAILSAELPNGDSVSINIQVVTPLQYDIKYSSDVYYSGGGFYSELSNLSDSIDFYFSFKNKASDLLSNEFGDVLAPVKPITITATIDSDELSFSKESYQNTYTYTTDTLNAGRCIDDLIMLFPNKLEMDRTQKKFTIKITATSDSFATFTEEYQFSINRIDTFIDKHINFVSKNPIYRTTKKNTYGNAMVTLKDDCEYIWSKYTTLDFENYSQIVFADLMINLLNVNQCQLASPVPAIISEWADNYNTILGGISDIVDEEYTGDFDLSKTNIDKLLKKSKYVSEPSVVDDELRDTIVDLLGNQSASKVNKIFAAVDKTSQVVDFIHLGENVLKDIIDWGNKITLFNAYTNATKEFKAVIGKLADVLPDSEKGMKDAVNDYINYDSGIGGQTSELLESFSGMMGHMTIDVFNSCIGKGMVNYLVVNLINWSGSAIKIGGALLNTTSYFSAVQTTIGSISTGVTLGLCLSDILCDSTDKSREMSKVIYMSKYTPYIIETLNFFENEMVSKKTDKSVIEFENAVALHKAAQSYVLEHTINSCKIKADSIIIKLFNNDNWEDLIADLVYHKNQINNLKCHDETNQYGDIISKSKVILVECPVNVTVFDSNGNIVLKIENNSPIIMDDRFYAVVAETSKYISVPSDQKYTIKIMAYDKGEMDYSVYEYNYDSGCTRKIITTDIPLTKNKEFTATIITQNDEPAELSALSVNDTIINITEDISISQHEPSVSSYFYGYVRDLYERPYTNTKYQYCGDMNLLYTLFKPYVVTDVNSSGQVKIRNTLYSLRAGIGSEHNPYLSYYFFGNAFTDAKAFIKHYQAAYGVNLNRMETISLSSGNYEINVFKTVLGLIELLYLPEDSYNYSSEEYKIFLAEEIGMSKYQFDLMTDDDIEIMQQLALWYIIQSDEKDLTKPTLAHMSKYPAYLLLINGEDDFYEDKRNAMNKFYTNLILKAIEAGEKYEFKNNSVDYTKPVNHFNKDIVTECQVIDIESTKPNIVNPYGHYYQIGPFEIASDKSISVNELEIFDATGKKIEQRYELDEYSYMQTYNVYDDNFRSVSEIIPGEKYYIRLWQSFIKDSSTAIDGLDIYDANCIKFKLSDSYYKASADYISSSNTEQDLVKLSKHLVSYSDEILTSIHSLVLVEEKIANCTQKGYQVYQCSDEDCDYEYRYETAKTEHNTKVVKAIPAKCDTNGQTEGLICNNCKTELITSVAVPALSHSEVLCSTIESTCNKNGSYGGSYCQICNSTLQKSTILPKKEHNYQNVAKSDYLKSKATCLSAAKYYVSCSECGEAGTSVFTYGNALGHSMSDSLLTKPATCTKNGKVENKCSICGYIKSTTVYSPKTIKLSTTSYTYNGKVKTPTVTIKDSKGNILKKNTDYTVSYQSGRKSPGKYTIKILFKGKYSGEKKIYFTIAPKVINKITATQTTSTITIKWNKVTGADGYRIYKYNTKTKKYEKLKDVTRTSLKISNLKAGTSYKYKVRAYSKNNGTIWGAYSNVFETSTKPTTPKITKLTTTKGQANFTWSNVSGESGYQVYYSTKKDRGYKMVASYKINVVKGSKSKLTSKKTYYFKVRSYKKTASGTVYSSWSAVKSIKIK